MGTQEPLLEIHCANGSDDRREDLHRRSSESRIEVDVPGTASPLEGILLVHLSPSGGPCFLIVPNTSSCACRSTNEGRILGLAFWPWKLMLNCSRSLVLARRTGALLPRYLPGSRRASSAVLGEPKRMQRSQFHLLESPKRADLDNPCRLESGVRFLGSNT